MSGEIVVPETPNWLQELEAKRERRLKARLGHEAGAGAPCLKCGEKCPGLDLHFWRKSCKICKCAKEEHEVQDDDIYGWAQFQLLGNKPNKIKRKIVLPGKKDEVELDWTPKGHNDTVDKYLKTLPPEQLPVKGSQAAQDRKQLLQKQIPVHDIDPTLCHELSNDELKQMNDYIAHVKQTSVGIGQIVSLSNIIKANLHMLNPSEAALIASRYPKGIPLSEIVKLQSQNKANLLKQQSLNQKLDNLNLQDSPKKSLPNFTPNLVNTTEENLNPWVTNKFHDVNHPGYNKDINQPPANVQFSGKLKPGQNRDYFTNVGQDMQQLDERFMQNPNFDPKNIPSQFLQQSTLHGKPYSLPSQQNTFPSENSGLILGDPSQPNSAFVPYNKISSGIRPSEMHAGENTKTANYPGSLQGRGGKIPNECNPGDDQNLSRFSGQPEKSYIENIDPLDPNFAKNLAKYPSGLKNTGDNQFQVGSGNNEVLYENVEEMRKNNMQGLPNYIPGKYNIYAEMQSPTKIPKSVKDLAFSTYDPNDANLSGNNQYKIPTGKYPDYKAPQDQNSTGLKSGQYVGSNNHPPNIPIGKPFDPNVPYGQYNDPSNAPFIQDSANKIPGDPQDCMLNPNVPFGQRNIINAPYTGGNIPNQQEIPTGKYLDYEPPNEQNSSGQKLGQYTGSNNYPPNMSGGNRFDESVPYGQYNDPSNAPFVQDSTNTIPGGLRDNLLNPNVPYGQRNLTNEPYTGGNNTNQPHIPYGTKPNKKLSELYPGKIDIDEDYLHPSHVTIGAIQDINYPEIKAATQGTNDFYEDYSPDSLKEILNNIKLPNCHYCKKPFEENEFAITIDRANVLFHAECFKCAGCNQILADNVYFYNKETDNVYCGRDYAKIRGFPRCKACDELIFTKEYCLAENSTFHLKHFCCIECDKPLAGQDYTLEDEMPYCLPCFEQSKASKCSSCDRIIKPDEIGCNLNGVHFHAVDECFACKVCKKPLMGKKLLLRNGKLYCSHDCFGTDKKE